MGSIRKRSGRYQAQVRRHGAQAVSRTFTTRKDALVWIRGLEARIDLGDTSVTAPKALTLGDLLARYCSEISPHKKGAVPEIRRLNRLLRDEVSKISLNNVNSHALASFRDRRIADGVRAAQYDLALIRHCWNIAKKEWGIPLPANPVSDIRVPNGIKHRDRRLHDGEFEKLKEAAKLSQNNYLWPMVQFAVYTAMRRSEILSLRWENVSMPERFANLTDTKNGTARQVPLSMDAISILKELPQETAAVFNTTDTAIRLAWPRLIKRAGIQDLRFHDLRHEAVSRFFEQGLLSSEVASISGHKDPRMLAKYTHIKMQHLLRKIDV